MSALPRPVGAVDKTVALLKEAEAKYPGITVPPTAWHAQQIIDRLDRLIDLQKQQIDMLAGIRGGR